MSLLPTAHAGQLFGTRRIDFFTVSGQVSDTDAHHGRITDDDGMDHEIRLMEDANGIVTGDVATVLRVQSGPNRRSCAVAVVDHSRGTWLRAAPDATTVLARSGVTRTFNWWLSILVLVLVAAASVWPVLHAFLTEMSAALMANVPVFDLYADLAVRVPTLSEWRLESVLPAGIHDALAGLSWMPMSQLTEWGLSIAAALMAIVAFAARSWRLIYVPILAVLVVLSGGILGGADTTLTMTGGALALFLIGGLVNRIRDGGRFNARVERLADHVLRNPPQEGVRTAEPSTLTPDAANAAAAIATATAVAEAAPVEAAPAESAPVEEATVEAAIVQADSAETVDDATADVVPAADAASENADQISADEGAGDAAAPVEATSEDTTDEAAEPELDDLPSLDEVKAAAALALAESETADGDADATESAPSIDLSDERTMPVAPPPPMPTEAEPAAAEEVTSPEAEAVIEAEVEAEAEPEAEQVAEPVPEPVPAAVVDEPSVEAPAEDVLEPSASAASEPVAAEPAAVAPSPHEFVAPADDPVIDDAADPMTGETEPGDYAPGAPDIEYDKSPAE
jgi:hypothetical protein